VDDDGRVYHQLFVTRSAHGNVPEAKVSRKRCRDQMRPIRLDDRGIFFGCKSRQESLPAYRVVYAGSNSPDRIAITSPLVLSNVMMSETATCAVFKLTTARILFDAVPAGCLYGSVYV
jgi:hypothetical protein